MYAIPNGIIKMFIDVEQIIDKIIDIKPTYEANAACWNQLCTPVDPKTLNSTNITKLIMLIEIKWIKPPVTTFI